ACRLALGLGVLVAFLIVGASPAAADNVQHGIGFTKGCNSPTKVGDPYTCTWTIRNVLDDAQDTLTINQIVDTIHTGLGNQTSATVLSDAPVFVSGSATCAAASGNGTAGNPYVGVTSCSLPFGGRVVVGSHSFYTVKGTDFTGANPLQDQAAPSWHDVCNDPAHTGNTNCTPNP